MFESGGEWDESYNPALSHSMATTIMVKWSRLDLASQTWAK
jgi:hypothetical protein